MNDMLTMLLVIAAYLAVQRWLLPRLGVPT